MRAFSAPIGAMAVLSDRVARLSRNVRLIVPLCLLLIFGSFEAATSLSMRADRAHALREATAFEEARAQDLAAVAKAGLDRFAEIGTLYADNPGAVAYAPGLINVAVFDRGHAMLALLHGRSVPRPPAAAFSGTRQVFAQGQGGGLSFPHQDKIVVVSFALSALAPPSLLRRAGLILPSGSALAGSSAGEALKANVAGWPLTAATTADPASALGSWYGALPLYLFTILGPAIAGAWLAALLVGAFERQEKAAHAIRSLKSTRPAEAKLMVRLAAAERDAVEALRSKSEFIAHMSHELRTPLNAVIGFSEVIGEGFFGPVGHPKYGEYARDIANAGRDLHAKIGNILEYANVEAGRHPLQVEAVDLAELAAAAVEEHKGRAFSRRIELSLGFAEPGAARGDADAVKRILGNLIANALTYTAPGGRVRLDVHGEDATMVLTVRDSGAGFSQGEQNRAGRPFQRFDRPGAVTGAGLGLAIAMELARRMGGAMLLSSPPAGGSLMELRLLKAVNT